MANVNHSVNVNVKGKGVKNTTKDLENLNGAIKKTDKTSRTLDRNMKGNSQMSANASKNFSKQAQGMQGILVPAYAEVAARVFALTAAYTALERAADFSILLKGQQLYAQQTGRNLGIVAKQIQEASGYMLDFKQASTSAGLAGTAGLNTQQILGMTSAARDASVALGRNLTDAFDRLTRGIVKGEPEILDEIGVLIRLDKVYKDYADTLGTTSNALTENQKLQARYNAIIDQATQKFGGIGAESGINEFSRLGAAASDALAGIGTVVNDLLAPVAKFLSEFREGLFLIFALVTKSLIGKIFPAFGEMGKKFDDFSKKARNTAKASRDAFSSTLLGFKETRSAIVGKAAYERALKSSVGKMAFTEKSGVTEGLATGNTAKAIKQLEKNIEGARGQLEKFGRVVRGPFKGQSVAAIDAVERKMLNLKGATEAAGSALTRMGNVGLAGIQLVTVSATGLAGALTTVAASALGAARDVRMVAAQSGTFAALSFSLKSVWGELQTIALAYKMIGLEATKTGKIMSLVRATGDTVLGGIRASATFATAAVTALTGAFSKLLGIFSVLSIGAFVGDLIMGSSRQFSQSKKAAGEFADAISSAVESLNKNEDRLQTDLSNTFAEMVASEEFKSNLATQLSESFSAAVKNIKLDVKSNTDWIASWIDTIQGAFGYGIGDNIARGISDGIEAIDKLGGTVTGRAAEDIRRLVTQTYYSDTSMTAFGSIKSLNAAVDRLKEGKQTLEDIDMLEGFLDEADAQALLPVLDALNQQYDYMEKRQKELTESLKGLQNALKSFRKEASDLGKDFEIKTPFDDLADKFNSTLKEFEGQKNLNQDQIAKFLVEALGENIERPSLEYIKTLKEIEKQEAKLASIEKDPLVSQADVSALEATISNLKRIAAESKKAFVVPSDFEAIFAESIGFNPAEEAKKAATRQGDIEKAKLRISVIDKTSLTAQKEVKQLEEQILQIQLDSLKVQKNHYETANAITEENATTLGYQIQIDNISEKLRMKEADRSKILEKEAYEMGRQVTFMEKMKNEIDKLSVGAGAQGRADALAFLNTEIANRRSLVIAERMKEITKDFKAALDTISSSFKTAISDAFEGYFTGEEKDPFRQTLGEGFIKGGAGIASSMVTEGVFGRQGLLGSAVKGVLGPKGLEDGGFFDQLFPPSAEELAERQLKQLETLRDAFIRGTAKVQVVKGQTSEFVVPDGRGTITDITDQAEDTLLGSAKEQIKEISKPFTDSIQDVFSDITKDFDFSFEGLKGIFDKGISGFGDIFTSLDQGLGSIFGMAGGLFGGPNGLINMAGNFLTGLDIPGMLGGGIDWLTGLWPFANGGIAKGGFRMYANGGIATQPHLGIVGEGKYNEAIVPLPDGKSIPVIGNTGGGNTNNVTVNVQVDSNGQAQAQTEGNNEMGKELGHRISQAVQEEIMMQQRPGGLLSQYKN